MLSNVLRSERAVRHEHRRRVDATSDRRAVNNPTRPYTIEFYDDPNSRRAPVHEWIVRELSPYQRRAIGTAMSEVLEKYGIDVCDTECKQLGGGLFEFRLRHNSDEIIAKHTDKTPDGETEGPPIFLRVFCHAYGDKIVLLLAGYDKGEDASERREDKEIELARKRLARFRSRRTGP